MFDLICVFAINVTSKCIKKRHTPMCDVLLYMVIIIKTRLLDFKTVCAHFIGTHLCDTIFVHITTIQDKTKTHIENVFVFIKLCRETKNCTFSNTIDTYSPVFFLSFFIIKCCCRPFLV